MVYIAFLRSSSTFKLLVSLGLLILFAGPVEAQITRTTDGITPPGLAPGAPAGSYPLSEFENINLYNGQVSFTLPIIQKGRGGANISLPIRITPKPWTVKHQRVEVPNPHPLPPGTMQDVYNAEPGWWNETTSRAILPGGMMIGRYSTEEVVDCAGTLYSMRTNTRLTFTAPDGTEYNLIDKEKGGNPRNDTCAFTVNTYRGSVFITSDGTSATFYSQYAIADVISASDPQWMYASTTFYPTGYLMLRDGTRFDILDGYVTRMRDHNGNEVRYEPIVSGGIIGWTITDSLKRQIIINYDVNDGPPYGVVDRITIKGFGGADRYIRISYNFTDNWLRTTQPTDPTTPWNIQQLFPQLDNNEGEPGGPLKVSTIWLPDDRTYKFKYSVYHELARVELPTGGAIEYDYSGGEPDGTSSGVIGDYLVTRYPAGSSVPLISIYRRLVQRRVYSGLSTSTQVGKTTYSKPVTVDAGLPTVSSSLLVEQWDPGSGACLARSKHYFQRSAHYSQLRDSGAGTEDLGESKEKRTDALGTSPPVPELRRVEHVWGYSSFVPPDNFGLPVPIDPHITESKTTLTDANLVSKQTFGYDQYNNQTDVYEHEYGPGAPGALVRRTHTGYVTVNNGVDYAANNTIHIRNLPGVQQVFDSTGTKRAEMVYEYDNYNQGSPDVFHAPLTNYVNISGHDGSFSSVHYTRGNVTKTTRHLLDNNGNVTGSTSSYAQYDIAGNIVKAIDPRSTATPLNIIATVFDFRDNFGSPGDSTVQSGGGPANNAPGWLGGQTSYAFPFKVTNALGHVNYTKYDYYLGRPVLNEDPSNIKSNTYFDDDLDRPTKGVRAIGTSAASQTRIIYEDVDAFGQQLRRISTISDKDAFGESTNGNGLKSMILYDGLGRTWRSATYEGNTGSGNTWAIADTQFDALGRVAQVSNPYRATDPASASAPSGTWTTTTYDSLGRVSTVETPDTAVVTTSYSGNAVTVTDQALKKRRSLTDALGRLIRVDEPDAGNNLGLVSSPVQPTYYTYDALDNLRRVQQGAQTRWFAYDSLSRLIFAKNAEQTANSAFVYTDNTVSPPNSQWSIQYQYDPNDNLTSKTDARPVTTTFTYDALNRVKTMTYSCNTPAISYVYDNQSFPPGAPAGFNRGLAVGRLVAVNYGSNSSAGSYYGYDELGRIVRKTQQINGNNYAVTNVVYNRASMMTSETYPSNRTVNYSYDIAGRLSTFSGTLGDGVNRTYATVIQYSAAGLKERESYGTGANGMTTPLYLKLRYNKRLQMVDLRLSSFNDETDLNRGALLFFYGTMAASSGNPFVDDTDNNGNLRRQWSYVPNPNGPNPTVTPQLDDYTYDSLNRVATFRESQINESGQTSPEPVVKQDFSYDRYGNRCVSNVTGGVSTYCPGYNTVNNRINGLGYDAVGNITNDPATGGTMIYDGENRMEMATKGGGGAYTYDGEGKRVKRMLAGGQEWWYVYGIGGELLAEYLSTAPTTVKKEYGYRAGQLLVVWDADKSGDERLKWLVADHLGSTRMEADKSGRLEDDLATPSVREGIRRHDYAPFGEEMYTGIRRNGSGQGQYGYEPPQSNIRERFTGKERDGETGLDYFGARYFASVQGRFTSPDEPFADQDEYDPQSWNLYTYVRNNPLRLVDPTGQSAEDEQEQEKKKKKGGNCLDNGACYNPKTGQYEIPGENGRTYVNVTIRPDIDNIIYEHAQREQQIQLFVEGMPQPEPPIVGAARGVKTIVSTVSRSHASAKLAANMIAKPGIMRRPGTVAHHIVAFAAGVAAKSRAILKKHKIDINAAENGVFLDAASHSRLHTNVYHAEVFRLLNAARNKAEVIKVLDYIADQVSKGAFPH